MELYTENAVKYTGPLKSYFTMQYFKSFFHIFVYINGLCFTIHGELSIMPLYFYKSSDSICI